MYKIRYIIIFILAVRIAHAQGNADMQQIYNHIQKEESVTKVYGRHVKMQFSYNPIKLILFVPLYLYQQFISEQVSSICEFEPSCSNFGLQSIKQLGIIKGLFLTAD